MVPLVRISAPLILRRNYWPSQLLPLRVFLADSLLKLLFAHELNAMGAVYHISAKGK